MIARRIFAITQQDSRYAHSGALMAQEARGNPLEEPEDKPSGGEVTGRPSLVRVHGTNFLVPCPCRLSDADLKSQLWKVIRALARMNVFLYHSDHLSDRELYGLFWRGVLQEAVDGSIEGIWLVDLVGRNRDEDIDCFLRYYASPEERRSWREKDPGRILPQRRILPYDRDRYLPRPS